MLCSHRCAARQRQRQHAPGNPNALGVSRELVVSAADYHLLGKMQYRQTLPLMDREVVLTFDDGPLPPYTDGTGTCFGSPTA